MFLSDRCIAKNIWISRSISRSIDSSRWIPPDISGLPILYGSFAKETYDCIHLIVFQDVFRRLNTSCNTMGWLRLVGSIKA